jgi:hypothetical protein
MKTSEQINEIAKAMCAAQGQMKPAQKDAINPHYKSKYSDISSVWESIRQPLSSNGITVLQDVTTEEKKISVMTRLVHSSGQWIEFGPLTIPLSRQDAHGIGSAISYAKRYAICAAVGVVSSDEDDDANETIKKSPIQQMEVKKPVDIVSKEKMNDFRIRYCSGENNEYNRYIDIVATRCKTTKEDIIKNAIQNEVGFLEAYSRWKEAQAVNSELKEKAI